MNRRDIVIGLVILAVLAGIVYFVRRPKQSPIELPAPTVEEKLEDKFQTQIPEGVEKAELKDVTGGNSSGIATRKFENGRFTHAVLADLPDPSSGEFYEGWLMKEGDKLQFISTGRMNLAKGGYLLDFGSSVDYSDYNKVIVTLEKKADKTPEEYILEGSF